MLMAQYSSRRRVFVVLLSTSYHRNPTQRPVSKNRIASRILVFGGKRFVPISLGKMFSLTFV